MSAFVEGSGERHTENPSHIKMDQSSLHFEALVLEVSEDGSVDMELPYLSKLTDDSDSSEEGMFIDREPHLTINTGRSTRRSTVFVGKCENVLKSYLCLDTMCGADDSSGLCSNDIKDVDYPTNQDDGNISPASSTSSDGGDTFKTFPSPRSDSFLSKLSEIHSKGIFAFISRDKSKRSKRRCSLKLFTEASTLQPGDFMYISNEEKFYASRWNGHLPLVPMSATNHAIQRKFLRRKRTLVTRGQMSTITAVHLNDKDSNWAPI